MIKKLLVIWVFVSFYGKIWGQNLVPNGDFEGYSGCPYGYGQIDSSFYWFFPITAPFWLAPDYFNQCTINSNIDIPDNFCGYQLAHSGIAYAGIYLWKSDASNFRNFLEVQLTSSLNAGACYHFEMYVNLGNCCTYATDDLSILFSDTAVNYIWLPGIQGLSPQIFNNTGNIDDTLNWTLISGNYVANGGENYLTIGNFNNDSNTSIISVNNTLSDYPYIYIDDVSLTPCATGINIPDFKNLEYLIYPNPAEESLTLTLSKGEGIAITQKTLLKIYDMLGKEILKSEIRNSKSEINIQSLKTGMYFIEINGERKKFVKQ